MKQGRTIMELAKEMERQRVVRKDFIADSRMLTLRTDERGNSLLSLDLDGTRESFCLQDLAHLQIAARLQIPVKYYKKMRMEHPSLLDWNVNEWFRKAPDRRMIRTLDGQVRAFLSDRYRRLDNLELAEAVFPILHEMKGAEILSCEITQTHLYLKVVNKRLKAEVGVGDVVQAGICISNSEVGLGSLKVEPLIYRLVCKNGLICRDYAQRRYHVGRQVESDDAAYEIYSDETLAADDKAFFLKVQDTVRTAVDEARFQLAVENFKAAKQESTGEDPVKTVEVLADRYLLSQSERGGILRYFILGGDNSQFGLINAITKASQDVEDYNRATELERLGGILLTASTVQKRLSAPRFAEKERSIKEAEELYAFAQ